MQSITAKANSKLSFLRRNLKGCPEKLRETAYFTLVRSFLEYSATVWHPDKLEMVQSRAGQSFFPKCISAWNGLALEIAEANTLDLFKSKLAH